MDDEMQIREELFSKMQENYNTFIEELKKYSPDKILDKAYEKVMKENILDEFTPEFKHYDIEKVKVLNNYKDPLDKLYKKWFHKDGGVHNLFEDSLYDILQDIMREQKQKNMSQER